MSEDIGVGELTLASGPFIIVVHVEAVITDTPPVKSAVHPRALLTVVTLEGYRKQGLVL